MGDSDGVWGELVERDSDAADVFDQCDPLPQYGTNPALDAFVDKKRITIAALVRLGARMSDWDTLAFAGPGWLKFRNIVSDRRWNWTGSDFSRMHVIRHGPEPSETCIIAEGETDAARLSDAYGCDVAPMPNGAGYWTQEMAEQLAGYKLVLVGLDNDTAGERGAAKIAEALAQARRFAPPEGANDWCKLEGEFPPLPDPEEPTLEMKTLVPAGELLELEPPEIISWLERGVLPVGGTMIIHGWAKSYKSFVALDLMAALAQGQPWCTFEPMDEPVKVAVMQYEIPRAYYQERVSLLRRTAREPEMFDQNFLTWKPLQRPKYVAGDHKAEDEILRALDDAGVQLFLLDPIRRAIGLADMNSEKEVRPLLAFYERLNDNGITVVTVHHDNKSSSRAGGGNPLGMTGAGAWAGDVDTIVSVGVPKGKSIDDPQRNMYFTMRNAPSVGPRGMEMGGDSHIQYSAEPFGDWDEDASPEGDSGPRI